jgi:hypothetical protein
VYASVGGQVGAKARGGGGANIRNKRTRPSSNFRVKAANNKPLTGHLIPSSETTVPLLVKKFPFFYGTSVFIAVFTHTHYHFNFPAMFISSQATAVDPSS